jgi:ribulose-5-phosphate 4-epimerase/fuculose-1-phosphate aldolase
MQLQVRRSNADEAVEAARADLAAAFRWAARLDLHEGVCNHFSLLVPGRPDHFLINPHGRHFAEMRARDLLMVDADGRLVEGDAPPEPTAFFIHWRIHQAHPNAACVLHTHMPHSTALTMLEGGRLEMAHQTALMFHDRIAYDDDYQGLALDEGEGDRIARVLGDRPIAFLANHGVVVTGASVAEAFDALYYLERACRQQLLAMASGRPLKIIPPDVCERTARQIDGERGNAFGHFAALRRLLDREEPDYRD